MNKIEVFLMMLVVLGMVLLTTNTADGWFILIGKVFSVTMMTYFGTKILFIGREKDVQKNNG